MKQIRRLFLLLCLITAGAQSARAIYYVQGETVTINNLKYELYAAYDYHFVLTVSYYACLVDILGTNEEVVVPEMISDGKNNYNVHLIGALIENNSMKSLKFQRSIDFEFSTTSWTLKDFPELSSDFEFKEYSGFIKSTSLQTIEFQGGVSNWDKNGARLLCPNMRRIVFYGDAPILSGTWSKYCTAPASNVTAVVTKWSQETCENKQLTATVWCEFKGVVPSLDLVHDATLKSNGGGDVQIWKNKNNKSQLDYTMSSEGGEELVTFYGNVDSYQVRVFCSSDYSKPVLKRNGTEVNLEAGSGYYYYDETSHMSVTGYEVVYNANYSRRLHFLNFGNGTVELSGESNGSAVSYVAEGMTETDYTFDKRTPVSVTITPQEGYKVQRIEHYGRIALPFTLNETTGVATTQYNFDDNESEQSLKIYYQKKVIPEGSLFRVRMSVEGAVGIGSVTYSDDGNYDWYDEDNHFGYGIAPGESKEVIGKYELDDILVFDFYVDNNLDEAEAAAGFVTTVKVYANGGLVECSNPGTEFGDYYRIPLDGGDMDVRVVFESNGRYLTGENGNGGNVAIYCEGSNTPLRIEAPGYWFWTLIPKTANPYVVITPLTGKTVVAVVRDGKLLSSLNNYRQSDGTYRIPLEGFDKGDSGYPLYVVYGDDISSVSIIEWNLLMVGDVNEVNSEDKKAYVMMYLDGDELLSTSQSEDSSVKTTCDIDKTWYLPASANVDFSIYVIPGQIFQVFFKGSEVTDNFVRNENYDGNGLLCYEYETDGYEQFAVDGTWTYVFKKAEEEDIIGFADENVKAICVENWDTNGDGELSKAEAAAVTTLRVMNEDMTVYASPFKNNAEIISFDELQYFTGLTEIADSAFYRCQTLQSVVVPNTLKIIKAYSFYYSPALTSVRLPEGLQKIGDFAFAVCTTLSNIHIPSTVTSLGTQAFSQCYALKQVIIPENVSKATHVFSNCHGLLSIFIPKNVTDIGSLSGCSSLTSIAVEPGNTVYDSRNGCNALIRTADNTLLHGCATTQIPEDIKTISGFAFSESRIETIDIPNGVETISGYAFQNCSMLTSVTIPESVTSIGNYTFYGCSRLKTVVSKIKEPFAFGTNCFSPALRKLIVPAGTRDAYIAAGWTENIFRDGIEEAPEDNSRYDLNGDDEVDIADVTKLVNKVLGNDQPSSNP